VASTEGEGDEEALFPVIEDGTHPLAFVAVTVVAGVGLTEEGVDEEAPLPVTGDETHPLAFVATVVVEGSTEAGEGDLVLQENKAVYFLRTNQLPSTLE
jgi:hypothetical protein